MKTIGVVLAGVFVGVVIVEIVRNTTPESIKKVEKRASEFVSSFKGAFREGYQKVA